jgi:uncharacterized membrane protein YukC
MNNAFINNEIEEKKDSTILRSKVDKTTEIIEALQNIASSSYWKVLQQNVFDVELVKSKRRLEVESNTTEIFRLQGEVRLGRRYNLEKLLQKYRDELQGIRKQL